MRSTHRAVLAVVLALAVAAGAAAATQTVTLGADAKTAPAPSPSALAAQRAKLAKADASIHRALTATPPPLPAVPKFAPLPKATVPPLVVTRVVPIASSSASAPTLTGRAREVPETHRSPPSEPSSATSPAPAAPRVHVDDDEQAAGGESHPEHHDD